MTRAIGAPEAARPADAGLPPAVELSAEERAALLDVARAAVAAAVGAAPGSSVAAAIERHAPVQRRAAAFVTLTRGGDLRGCVGHMDAGTLVVASVVEAARWAALGDPRFDPVRPTELRDLHLEVSVLGPLIAIADPAAWRLGVDGIVVEARGRRGLLLPEVAPMLGNDRSAMLATACRKAGLAPDAWRRPGMIVYAFRTDRFGGPA